MNDDAVPPPLENTKVSTDADKQGHSLNNLEVVLWTRTVSLHHSVWYHS